MVVGFAAGLLATLLLAVIVGVTAGYVGGATDDGLSLVSNVFLAIPGLPLLIVIDSYLPSADRSNSFLIGAIISSDGLGVGSAGVAGDDLVAAQPGLRRSIPHHRRVAAAHHARRGRAEPAPGAGVLVPLHGAVLRSALTSSLAYIGLHEHGGVELGNDALLGSGEQRPARQRVVVVRSARVCIALVGTGLALLNFGIDEFINPGLRSGGVTGRAARRCGSSWPARDSASRRSYGLRPMPAGEREPAWGGEGARGLARPSSI